MKTKLLRKLRQDLNVIYSTKDKEYTLMIHQGLNNYRLEMCTSDFKNVLRYAHNLIKARIAHYYKERILW